MRGKPREKAAIKQMKTLIVEDDIMSQCLLAKVMAERGYEVTSFDNAEQAILAYQQDFYPLLLVDVDLPGMDGLQFCKWVRSQPNGDKVFIMVATSTGQPEDMEDVLDVGANDFLVKPYDVGTLAVRLTIAEWEMKDFFERKQLEDALRGSQQGCNRVFEAANEGAWLLNAQFQTDYVNPQMAAMIGYPAEELANRAVIDFLPETAQHEAEQLFAQQSEGLDVKTEISFRRKDGSECQALLSATPVRNDSGEFTGSLWMVADLTGRKSLETELAQTRETLETEVVDLSGELDKSRKAFEAECAERKKLEQTLWQARAESEARSRQESAERTKIADELKSEAAVRREAEGQLAKTRDELAASTREFTVELAKAKEAQHAELESEVTAHRRAEVRNAAFLKLGRELSAVRMPIDVARTVAGVAHELLGWDACSFGLYSAEENRIQPVLNIDTVNGRAADVSPAYSGPDPGPIMQRVVKDGPQLILRSAASETHTDYVLFGDRARLSASLMYVGVRAGNRIVALLSVQSYAPGAYNEEDLATLQTLADLCGGVLERIRAEEIQRRTEARFQLVARATNDIVWDWNLETNRIWWNAAFHSMSGCPVEERQPGVESWSSRIHPEDNERVMKGVQSVIRGGGDSWSDEYRFRRSDGSYARVFHRSCVIRSEDNTPLGIIGVIVDVSPRKQPDAALIERQPRMDAILEAALDAIVTIDHEGKVSEWNPAAEKMFGHRRAEVLGHDLAELIIPPSLRDRHRSGMDHALAQREGGGAVVGRRVELKAMRADGTVFPIEMTVVRLAGEGPPTFTGFIRDITDRLGREAQTRHAERMESIGQLAGGVAHDFNNLLGVVQGYSTLLLEEKDIKPEIEEMVRQIASATERACHLTSQLLTFSRKQTIHVRTTDLNELINGVVKLLRRVSGENIALQFNYPASLPPVEVDTGMIEQAVMNLAIHARDSMPAGGQLSIATKTIEIDDSYVQHHSEARAGRFVCLSVTDTGGGMDEATRERIFEPFISAKNSGKGTGLGLAAVYGIVKQHEGWIEVQSRVAQGTTFQIFLPASSKTIAPPAAGEIKLPVRGGTETILLVEDEPVVLAMARGILKRFGYQVITAASGDAALLVWQQNAAQVDLLLTDMVMPGSLNGRELAEKLLQEKPGLKVLYTSGYSVELLGPGLATNKNFVFLQKPYHPEVLAQTVRNCLEGKRSD